MVCQGSILQILSFIIWWIPSRLSESVTNSMLLTPTNLTVSLWVLQQDFSFDTMRPSIWPIMWIFSIFESYWHLLVESIHHNVEISQRSFNVIFTNLRQFGHFGALHNIPYMVGRLALFHSSLVSISFFLCRVLWCNTHDEMSTFSQCSTSA